MAQESQRKKKALENEIKNPSSSDDNGTYNREKAVQYAHQWYNKRNPGFIDYSDVGGNCNNFISQCLIAGGIKEDDTGNNIWFGATEDKGTSLSWIIVDYFHDYAENNNSGGFKAEVSDNYFSGQPGDIIQLGLNDNWKHSVIITGLIKDKDGNTIDYLVDSNTRDHKEIPVSTYGYPHSRLIKIIGNIK